MQMLLKASRVAAPHGARDGGSKLVLGGAAVSRRCRRPLAARAFVGGLTMLGIRLLVGPDELF